MLAKQMLSQIVNDDALTRGLGDSEARLLVEWLVDQAEKLSEPAATEESLQHQVAKLCRRARAIVHFVRLWNQDNDQGAAFQLAAVERFGWPLPTEVLDPYELLQEILIWEERSLEAVSQENADE